MAIPAAPPNQKRRLELYKSFEHDARDQFIWPRKGPFQEAELAFKKLWESYDADRQTMIAGDIEDWRILHKAHEDAKNQANETSRYRGAPGDEGNEDDGRCRIQLHFDRLRAWVRALDWAILAARSLMRVLTMSVVDYDVDAHMDDLEGWNSDAEDELFDDQDPEGYGVSYLRYNLRQYGRDKKRALGVIVIDAQKQLRKDAQKRVKELEAAKEHVDESMEIDTPAYNKKPGQRIEIMPSEIDFTQDWVGSWPVGKGGFGRATVWVSKSKDYRIVNRIVLKEVRAGATWKLPEFWTKGHSLEKDNLPVEIQSHLNVRGKEGSSYIAEMLDYKVVPENKFYRLYLEFCPYGDLYKIAIGDYPSYDEDAVESQYYRSDKRRSTPFHDFSDDDDMLPEPFLWYVFESLTSAGLVMERGQTQKNGAPNPWDVIVHRDLKLHNVFGGVQSGTTYKRYPQPKVGDFGLAIHFPGEHELTKFEIRGGGTPGHHAPEQKKMLFIEEEEGKEEEEEEEEEDDEDMDVEEETNTFLVPLSTKTNVWGMGIVMWSLLSSKEGPSKDKIDFMDEETKEPPEFDATAQGFYSNELLSLVRACTRYDVRDRPSFDAVMRRIQKQIKSDTDLAAMRNGTASTVLWQRNELLLDRRDTTYTIGLSMGEVHPYVDIDGNEYEIERMELDRRMNEEWPIDPDFSLGDLGPVHGSAAPDEQLQKELDDTVGVDWGGGRF